MAEVIQTQISKFTSGDTTLIVTFDLVGKNIISIKDEEGLDLRIEDMNSTEFDAVAAIIAEIKTAKDTLFA